jgi:uncharacterized protein (TIGR03067 family)
LLALAGFLGAGGSVRSDVPKKELEALQGQYRINQANGMGVPGEEILKRMRAVIAGDRVSFFRKEDGADKEFERWKIVGLDTTKTPKAIELEIERQKVPGIYKLEKDVLTICFGKDQRPTGFEFKPGSGIGLYVLKRQPK